LPEIKKPEKKKATNWIEEIGKNARVWLPLLPGGGIVTMPLRLQAEKKLEKLEKERGNLLRAMAKRSESEHAAIKTQAAIEQPVHGAPIALLPQARHAEKLQSAALVSPSARRIFRKLSPTKLAHLRRVHALYKKAA
jgi:hypothetical protein